MKFISTLLFLIITSSSSSLIAQNKNPDSNIEILFSSNVGSFYLPTQFNSKQFPRCIEGCEPAGSAASKSTGIGFEARLKIYEFFHLSSGVSYTRNAYYEQARISAGGPSFITKTQRDFHFIDIPFKSHLKLLESTKEQRYSVYFDLGVINHINLNSEYPGASGLIELKKYGLSGTVSLGIAVSFNKLTLELAPYYRHSLTSFGNDIDPFSDRRLSDDAAYSPNEFSPRNLGVNFNFALGL
ncbi:MAG: hypothetical protein ROO71_14720 [Balneola sp.]